jgi:hypothetical protein
MEEWRPIQGTKGFIEVSNEGRVRSLLRGEPRILKTQTDNKGYHRIRVTIERDKRSYKVHREVAKAFIPNPERLPQVNHRDGNKDNNSVNNLEWVTNQENAIHAIKNGLWDSVFESAQKENERRKKPVIGIDPEGKLMRFESVSEAERHLDSRHISDVLKAKRSHVKGWTFVYAEGGDHHSYSNLK